MVCHVLRGEVSKDFFEVCPTITSVNIFLTSFWECLSEKVPNPGLQGYIAGQRQKPQGWRGSVYVLYPLSFICLTLVLVSMIFLIGLTLMVIAVGALQFRANYWWYGGMLLLQGWRQGLGRFKTTSSSQFTYLCCCEALRIAVEDNVACTHAEQKLHHGQDYIMSRSIIILASFILFNATNVRSYLVAHVAKIWSAS